MRNVTHRCPKSGHFFPKLGQFFPIFEKRQGRPPFPPLPPLVTRLISMLKSRSYFLGFKISSSIFETFREMLLELSRPCKRTTWIPR